MTNLERWHRFSLIYAWGLLFLAPLWMAAALCPDDRPIWHLAAVAGLAPVVQIAVALRICRPQRAFSHIGAAVGGIAVCGLSCLFVLVPGGGVAMLFGPLLAGAALGQVLAGAIPLSVPQARKGASVVASIAGGLAGLALFYLFFEWAMDHIWTDSLYAIPYGLSLWALAASAAFLVWFLGRE